VLHTVVTVRLSVRHDASPVDRSEGRRRPKCSRLDIHFSAGKVMYPYGSNEGTCGNGLTVAVILKLCITWILWSVSRSFRFTSTEISHLMRKLIFH
jgi:hypothetical protein